MNNTKKCSGAINSNKNKLNSEIILIFNPNPHYNVWEVALFNIDGWKMDWFEEHVFHFKWTVKIVWYIIHFKFIISIFLDKYNIQILES